MSNKKKVTSIKTMCGDRQIDIEEWPVGDHIIQLSIRQPRCEEFEKGYVFLSRKEVEKLIDALTKWQKK